MDLINTKQRIALFTETLKQPNLDFDIIANLSFNGIPDIHRPIYWRILLKYLPTKKEKWIQVLKNKRNSYNIYQEEFIDSSFKSICYEFLVKDSFNLSMIRQKTQGTKIKEKDLKIIENIIKDVSRTQLDYDLCREDENNDSLSNNSISNNQAISPNNDNQNSEKNNENENENENKNKKNKENEKNGENQIEEKIENKNPKSKGLHLKYQMCEIIYLFTRLNSGFGFVQGMSEILVPIFCLFKNDPNEEWRKFSNHDTFFCFTNLMSEIGHHFCQDFDQTDLSIHASLQRVDQLVAFFDPKLASHFKSLSITAQSYSFGWITMLFSQEFPTKSIYRLWDSLFADEDRFRFISYICAAMPMLVRDSLFKKNEMEVMDILQNYPKQIKLDEILQLGMTLLNNSKKKNARRKKTMNLFK